MRRGYFRWITILGLMSLAGSFGTAKARAQSQNGAETPPPTLNAIPSGYHFLVGLDDELSTEKDKVNRKFEVKTLEPLQSTNGSVIPPGAKIRGHISRIEPAGTTGRARIWLTFDNIDTHHGRLPLVAFVSSVPGEFSVKPGESKEGEIEARTSNRNEDLEAAAGGAAMGAKAGARATHNAKGAAAGAAMGGLAGFLAASGFGQELDLQKGTKLDLVLDRPLYLN